MDINEVLARSKRIMENTKNMPYGGYVDQAGLTVNNHDGEVVFKKRMANYDGAPMFSEQTASNSKMPKEIIEAMRKSSSSSETSVLNKVQSKEVKQRNPYEKLNEQINTPQPQTTPIDYSLIRMMIDESIKKYMGQLKKSLLSESKNNNSENGLQMMTKKGNTFKFITEDGKIYEAKMIYKGNLNE